MEIYLTLIGLIIAALGFWYQFFRPPIEELKNFEIQFHATRELSISLQKDLEEIAAKLEYWDEIVFRDITYNSFISLLETTRSENLSLELLKKVKDQKMPKETILSMSRSLESQFSELNAMKSEIKMRLNQLVE